MAAELAPYGRVTQRPPAVKDVHILWITAGLGCDGDSVSITAATQPSIEDVLMGAIPGLPKVHLHNPVLAYEVGDDFMKYWYQAEQGLLDPFVLVVEGSIPNEHLSGEGYWAALGNDPMTDQPIPTTEWIDRLAPKAVAVVAFGTCATYGGIHAMRAIRQAHGTGRLSRLGLEIEGRASDRQRARLPGAAGQLHGDAAVSALSGGGPAPMIPLDDATAPDMALRQDRARRLRPRGLLRAGRFRHRIRLAQVHRQARLLGAGGELQRAEARVDGWHRRLSERRRHLHRLHDARLPGQVHAVHGRTAGRKDLSGTIGVYGG